MTREECYHIFGMNSSITKEELKRRYRILIKRYHPDIYTNLSERDRKIKEEYCKKINEAYTILLKDDGVYYSSYNYNTSSNSYNTTSNYYRKKTFTDILKDISRYITNSSYFVYMKYLSVAYVVISILELIFSSWILIPLCIISFLSWFFEKNR